VQAPPVAPPGTVVATDPKAAGEANKRGAKLNAQRRYDEAIKEFDEAIRLDPEMTGAWATRAHALVALGKLDEAAESANKALELSTVPKTRAVAHLALGYVAARQGNLEEAQATYQKALAEHPSYQSAKNALEILRSSREPSPDLVAALNLALAGQPVTDDRLPALSREEKLILAAAPHARHGLPLESPSVASFFYSSPQTPKLKLKEDPSATDDVLLPVDRENLRTVKQSLANTKAMQKDDAMANPFQL
jgi:tetratricopeptide (TPR) repeat protein